MVGLNALVEMACFAYPAFMAIKSLKESSGYEVWLTYFMIFSSFHVMEALYGHPDPMTDSTTYILFKLVVLVLCFLPMTNGAERIYKMGIKRVIAAADAKTD
uniref:Uncharacterized protein n=2 Tax=Amorphochlora amoebiformis TaxID=1561963 RepID=A0A7S0GZG3_9EUKA|mmetsp:Transcript_2943/g.4494  ORF Transcript_2943/g.4494 Transcript_2943/m.4494 type:complete len:102 (+) Transcript_2943:218-523(+)